MHSIMLSLPWSDFVWMNEFMPTYPKFIWFVCFENLQNTSLLGQQLQNFFRILHCLGFIIALQKVLCTLGLILVFNLQYVLLLFFAALRSVPRLQSTAGRYAALKLQQDNKCFVFSSRIYIFITNAHACKFEYNFFRCCCYVHRVTYKRWYLIIEICWSRLTKHPDTNIRMIIVSCIIVFYYIYTFHWCHCFVFIKEKTDRKNALRDY